MSASDAPATRDYIRSALFVDFDNVFIELNKIDRSLAARFARNPVGWVHHLEEHHLPEGARRRRVLVRRCYLNPDTFGQFRSSFVAAAFETVDCPPLTFNNKTSADMHIALDMVDALHGMTRYDEFIVMSADADFVPVLMRLRRHDRRTAILASGNAATAYASAADIVITQDAFLDFVAERVPAALAPDLALAPAPALPPEVVPEASDEALAAASDAADSPLLDQVADTLRTIVADRAGAIDLASLAHALRDAVPELGTDWGGHERLGVLLRRVELGELVYVSDSPGYLYDPARQPPPLITSSRLDDRFDGVDAELRELVGRVTAVTGIPRLAPGQYTTLFERIAAEVNERGYASSMQSAKSVRDECTAVGMPVSRQAVTFVLSGLERSGHDFGRERESAASLARTFRDTVEFLCRRADIALAEEDLPLLARWIGVGEGADAQGRTGAAEGTARR